MEKLEGFIVHSWTEFRTGRIFLSGRAVDGRSFAAAVDNYMPAVYVPAVELEQAIRLATAAHLPVHPVQPESAIQAIRWAIGPLPALLLVLGLVLAGCHRLDRSRHARMVNLLKRRSTRRGVASSGGV